MFENLSIRHVPTLFVAAATTFGGIMPFFNAKYAIEEFGPPKRIARVKEAQAIMVLSSARITTIGATVFTFYFQNKLTEVDTIMIIMGAYVGAVDGYVCWREGVPNKAIFRAASGAAIAAWVWFGMTADM